MAGQGGRQRQAVRQRSAGDEHAGNQHRSTRRADGTVAGGRDGCVGHTDLAAMRLADRPRSVGRKPRIDQWPDADGHSERRANGETNEDISKKIKFALVECKYNCDSGSFAKPSQATITYAQYPLVRPLYYILKENSNGLGSGFTNFLNLERGQLVFRRSYLVPATMYFGVRTGSIQ